MNRWNWFFSVTKIWIKSNHLPEVFRAAKDRNVQLEFWNSDNFGSKISDKIWEMIPWRWRSTVVVSSEKVQISFSTISTLSTMVRVRILPLLRRCWASVANITKALWGSKITTLLFFAIFTLIHSRRHFLFVKYEK